jgi:acyl-CoA dehydrogenase
MTDPLRSLREGGPDPALEGDALGGWLLTASGLERPPGLLTVAATSDGTRVPWARRADWLIFPADEGLMLAPMSGAAIEPGENLAGEERDRVALGNLTPQARLTHDWTALNLRGALVRAALMAGALERICQLSLDHARERHQFGRAIASFQAVQAHLVTIAQQAALVSVAVDAAMTREAAFEIAAAKLLAARAALTATRAAHQVHGAVGVTRSHPLGVQTRRLWAWRNEFGDHLFWANRLGGAVVLGGADRLYPAISAGSAVLEV